MKVYLVILTTLLLILEILKIISKGTNELVTISRNVKLIIKEIKEIKRIVKKRGK